MGGQAFDTVVVGAGPNGLSAAIEMARAGLSVCVVEARETIGGGARSAALTHPGLIHDVCSAIHPMGVLSPFFRTLHLERWGLEWVYSPAALAHPFDDGSAVLLCESIEETGRRLGPDGDAYARLMRPFLDQVQALFSEVLAPIRFPRHPLLVLRFGRFALQSSVRLVNSYFRREQAKAMLAGCAAHAMVPLDRPGTASFGLVLALAAHAVGWPCARGGSQQIVEALAHCLRALGGVIWTSYPVRSAQDLPPARCLMLDLTPRQVIDIVGEQLPPGYRRRLSQFRYGPGVFKLDWALGGPIPWRAGECYQAATVHLGGTAEEIAAAEDEVGRGKHPERPFILVAQQSLFDPTRASQGKQTGWAYCHVPRGSDVDLTERIERQVERFAPGFRDRILARHTCSAQELERYNWNMVGGDIGGGANDLWQLLARPVARFDPYSTPNEKIFLCSSSTPPGGGVHGMCGYWAARSALRRRFHLRA